jgi:hypothetical protein
MRSQALRCHHGCGTELAAPEFSVVPFLEDMRRNAPCVVYRINQAYSAAVWERNHEHLTTCHGVLVEPVTESPT